MSGQTEAPSISMAKALLRQQGINPTRVRKKATLFGIGGGRRRKKLKPADTAIMARQLATMMAAGVPLVQSMDLMAQGARNPLYQEVLTDIRGNVESGMNLADALQQHPKYFDDLFVNLVAAGEASGTLETLLDKIATYKEKNESIKSKVRKALFYPSAVIIVAFIVSGFLLYFVVPEFESLFQGFGADLPAFTRVVIGLSDMIQQWWWLIIMSLIASVVVFVMTLRRSYNFRRRIDKWLLKLPIVGDIFYKSVVARFSRTLSTMFAAGVPLVEALDSVAGASGNIVFEEGTRQIRSQVATGQKLQTAMSVTGLFPTMAEQMIAIGEESGALDDMCARIAGTYEEQVDDQVDALSSLLEPLIMVLIGVLVGGLVIAMYLPIFKLGSVV